MALYIYVKAVPKPEGQRQWMPLVLVVTGFFLMANVTLPIFLYQLRSGRFQKPLVVPVVESREVDYTKPSSWFPSAPSLPAVPSKITHYNISVPKLGIENAVVQIGGEDLAKSLIQYPGTAWPGQYGNTVIFGHSVLPQFFNPKYYKTIFSTLPKLKEGDEVIVNFDGIKYRYQVVKMIETSPTDVSILEQHYDAEYLTLITCVPPGTYLRRLVIKARLIAN